MSSAEQKRLNKLPPRLAKQRQEKEKEKHLPASVVFLPPPLQPHQQGPQSNVFSMPKIENWDNEMANNIPAAATTGVEEVVSEQGSE